MALPNSVTSRGLPMASASFTWFMIQLRWKVRSVRPQLSGQRCSAAKSMSFEAWFAMKSCPTVWLHSAGFAQSFSSVNSSE